jgi:hypothetical protein
MPLRFTCENPNWLRNTLVTLNKFSVVDLHWENDWRESNKTGEPAGEWKLIIETAHGDRIKGKHEDEALQNLETREAELWVKIKEAQSQVDSLSAPWSEARNAIAKEKQRREIIAELAKEEGSP